MKRTFLINRLAEWLFGLPVRIAIVLLWFHSNVSAQSFHLLVFADTEDTGLTAPNLMNISFLQSMAKTVCASTGMQNRMVVYQGKDFVASRCDQILTALKPEPDDVVFFYFMGHGWNNGETEEPMLLFSAQGQNPGKTNSRNLKAVFEQLQRKGNRLTMVFGESCNSAINDRSKAKPARTRLMNVSAYDNEQLKNLFLKSRMTALLHTCKLGQKSYSNEDGGWFFTSFYNKFVESTTQSYREQPAQWDAILRASAEATTQYAFEQGAKQEPVFHVFTGNLAVATPTAPSKTKSSDSSNESVAPTTNTDSEPGNICNINRSALKMLETHLEILQNFMKRVSTMNNDAAADEFRKYYSTDRKEFFHELPKKLNTEHLTATKANEITELSRETAEILDETVYYVDDPNFKTSARGKLSIPIDNIQEIIKKGNQLILDCRK